MARSFDGSDDRAQAGVTALTTLSIHAWIKLAALPADEALVAMQCNDVQPATEWSGGCFVNASGNVVAYVFDGAAQSSTGTSVLSTGVWYPVGCSILSGGTLKVYVNGASEASTAIGTPFSAWSSGPIIKVAGSTGSFTSFLQADIADVTAWDVELNANEFAAMAAGVPARRIRPSPLFWPFWGLESPEPNMLSGGNSMTLTGTTQANHAPVSPVTRGQMALEVAATGNRRRRVLIGAAA